MENSVVDLTAERARSKSNDNSRKMKQRNLFGAVVKSPDETGVSKSRKRKDPPGAAAASRPSAFVQAARAAAGDLQPAAAERRQSKFVEAARAAAIFSAETSHEDTFTTSSLFAQQKVMWNATFPSLWEKAMLNMKNIFRIDSLRNLQPIAVECALKRQSQIIVMATGGGKSLCYQLPATVIGGVTLVISPLIALMVDQVQALNDKGVAAAMVSSANGARANNEVMERLLGRPLKAQKKRSKSNPPNLKPITVLYGTPELCQTERFRKVLFELHEQNRLASFAIDEAHCLSTWGHDFRPAFRSLSWLRTSFPNIPCTACTATATAKVIEDIRSVLLLKPGEVPCHVGSFNRPNITYEVRYKQSLDAMSVQGAMGDLVELVQQQHMAAAKESCPCSGIIYVHKRQDCDSLAKEISKRTGIRAAAYHAGLKDAQRSGVQREWTSGSIQVVVATISFGMG
jgi:ATP-dependent DNA helicase RecQ